MVGTGVVAVDGMVLRMVLDFADVVAGCAQDRGRGGGHGAHAGFVGEERVLVGGYSAGHEGLCEVGDFGAGPGAGPGAGGRSRAPGNSRRQPSDS